MTSFEVISMGAVSVDLYPEQPGATFAEVETFAKSLGGSAANVAVMAARLGHRSAVISKVGEEGFGPYVRSALERYGVDARWVGTDPNLRTSVICGVLRPPEHFPAPLHRETEAPDVNLTLEDLDLDAITAARIFWTTASGLCREPGRGATLAALEARFNVPGGITVHDRDYCPWLWNSAEEAGRCAREALRHASVAVGGLDGAEITVGTRDPLKASASLLELGVELAVVKKGRKGVLARSAAGVVEVPAIEAEEVNRLGVDGAFGGALCHAFLLDWDLERAIRYASAASSVVALRPDCAEDMPTDAEILEMLRGWSAGV